MGTFLIFLQVLGRAYVLAGWGSDLGDGVGVEGVDEVEGMGMFSS